MSYEEVKGSEGASGHQLTQGGATKCECDESLERHDPRYRPLCGCVWACARVCMDVSVCMCLCETESDGVYVYECVRLYIRASVCQCEYDCDCAHVVTV